MEGSSIAAKYPECVKIQRQKLDVEVSPEQALKLFEGLDSVLPLYEQKVHDYKRMKNCSLNNNELLRCRWKSLVHNIEGKQHQPFEFPHLSDFHFSNCSVRFNPAQTITNRPTYRFHLRNGPGVDAYGQIPIPNDIDRAFHGRKS